MIFVVSALMTSQIVKPVSEMILITKDQHDVLSHRATENHDVQGKAWLERARYAHPLKIIFPQCCVASLSPWAPGKGG